MLDEFNEKRQAVLDILQDLAALSADVGSPTVVRRVEGDLAAKLRANRFHLVVVGEFNHGKTTFVNALLGGHILPVGVTPTTAVIHEIGWADQPSAKVVYESGETRALSFDDVRYFAIGNETPSPDPGPVKHLEIGYPADLLRHQISLVDTPGVNDLSLQRSDITYKYIPQSDAVLFLLDAGQLVKESERVFLQQKLLGQSRDKIVFVVTKRDILEPPELEEAMRYVHDQLRKIVDDPRVFSVSAQQALDGRRGESGMDELLAWLTRFLSEERGRILLDNAYGEALRLCSMLGKGLDAKRRGLEMSVEEIDRRIELIERDLADSAKTAEQRRAAIREEVAAIKAWSRRDLDRFVQDVCAQIPGMVDKSEVADLKAHLGPFLEKTVRDWAAAETREIAVALESLAEKTIALVREDARDSARRLADVLGSDLRAPTIEIDTFVYDVGVAALATVGLGVFFANWMLGGVLILAAPVLAVIMHGRVETETRERAKELAPIAVREAAARIAPKLEEMIDTFGQRLDAWVVSASEDVYREVIEVLRATRKERERGEAARALASSTCQKHEGALEALAQKLTAMRAALWPAPPAELDAPPAP
jgi:ribosome biogenesis GTPase A